MYQLISSSLGCPHAGTRSHAAINSLAICFGVSEKSHTCSWEFVMVTGIQQAAFIATSSSHPTARGMLCCFSAENDSRAGIWLSFSSLDTATKILFSFPATLSPSPANIFYLQHLLALQTLWQVCCSSCVKKNLVLASTLSTNFSSNSSSSLP